MVLGVALTVMRLWMCPSGGSDHTSLVIHLCLAVRESIIVESCEHHREISLIGLVAVRRLT
jgi:hypothetical protein